MNKRVWNVLNVSLVLISFLLILNLFDIQLPTLGKAKYLLDKEDPLCIINWKQEYSPLKDLDLCCSEARKQLECVKKIKGKEIKRKEMEEKEIKGDTDWVCKTGSGNVIKYMLNNKAYNYCKLMNFW